MTEAEKPEDQPKVEGDDENDDTSGGKRPAGDSSKEAYSTMKEPEGGPDPSGGPV